MTTFTVTAQRGNGPVWVLECSEVGAVSQTRRLDNAADEMREAIAYLADLPEDDIQIDVVPVLAPELVELKKRAEEQRAEADIAREKAAKTSREVVQHLRGQGYSLRDIGVILGVSYQRVAALSAGTPGTRKTA